MKVCKNPDCEKTAISFSEYCGQHTDNEAYACVLNNLSEPAYTELFISEVEVEDVHLSNMVWYDCTIEDCAFGNSSLIKITFCECTIRDSYFTRVTFQNSGMKQESVLASTTFENCRFLDYELLRTSISNVHFQMGTIWQNSVWKHLQLANTDIMKSSIVDGLDVTYCVFDHCSFQEADVRNLRAKEVKIKVSFAHNTHFSNCHLEQYESDLEDLDFPTSICLFDNCEIDKSLSIEGFANWNGIDESPESFYDRVLHHIEEVLHINNLSPLEDIVKRIYSEGDMNFDLAKRLQRIFVKYFDQIKKTGDLHGLGTIINLISRLPQELIIDKSQYLPAPKKLSSRNVLRIEIKNDVSDLETLHEVLSRLYQLDHAIQDAGHGKLVLEDFKKGSVTVVVSSTLAAMVLLLWLLYKAGHLYLNTENLVLTNQQLKRDKKLSKKHQEKLDQELKINKQQIILNDLEIEKRKQALQSQNLPDQYIPVTREEVSNLTGEDPFDRLELKQLNMLQKAADDVTYLGATNVYIELLENEIGKDDI